MKMLPVFYQAHLKSQLNRTEYLFLQILINVLQAIKNVSLEKLATALPLPILFESRRKKIQRFLSQPNWNKDLGLSPGVSLFLQGVKVTKTQGFVRFNIASKWKRKYLGWTPEEGWFILTNLDSLQSAIQAYKQRFDIEEMFRDLKSGGYNLEGTHVSGERLISLILLLAIAYSSATFFGKKIKRLGVQKYVGRVKEYGRTYRRHSSFYVGLYGQTWVDFMEPCQALISQLIQLNLHKRLYYQRGLRAMNLIMSTF